MKNGVQWDNATLSFPCGRWGGVCIISKVRFITSCLELLWRLRFLSGPGRKSVCLIIGLLLFMSERRYQLHLRCETSLFPTSTFIERWIVLRDGIKSESLSSVAQTLPRSLGTICGGWLVGEKSGRSASNGLMCAVRTWTSFRMAWVLPQARPWNTSPGQVCLLSAIIIEEGFMEAKLLFKYWHTALQIIAGQGHSLQEAHPPENRWIA